MKVCSITPGNPFVYLLSTNDTLFTYLLATNQIMHWSTGTNSAVWPVPYACAQSYHPGSGSHGQLFRPFWGSSAWHNRRINEGGKKPAYQRPLTAGESAKHSFKRRAKQVFVAVTAGVIWLYACVRYWPYHGVGKCASVHNLFPTNNKSSCYFM